MPEEEASSSAKFAAQSGGMADHRKEQNYNTEIHEDKNSKKNTEREIELIQYLPLYGAALEGDWDTAKRFFDFDSNAKTAKITDRDETALHIAVNGGNSTTRFVTELVNLMPPESLEQLDIWGNTVLHYAAAAGNTKAAKILVEKNSKLLQIGIIPRFPERWHGLPKSWREYHSHDYFEDIPDESIPRLKLRWDAELAQRPLHVAAENGHRNTFLYLLSVTKDDHPISFTGARGISQILHLIKANLNDIALDLLRRYPSLAQERELQKDTLEFLAQKPSRFASGSQLGYWRRLIYRCIPVGRYDLTAYTTVGGDIETSIEQSKDRSARFKHFGFLQGMLGSMLWKVNVMFWNTIIQLVPGINHIRDTKLIHMQTLELVKLLCAKVTASYKGAKECLEESLFMGIESGIHELVREIIKTYPPAASFLRSDNSYQGTSDQSIFELAVLHRQEKVFSLIYQMGLHKQFIQRSLSHGGRNVLHYAAELKPSSQVSGAALQMQRELQWFKVVETLVQPSLQEEKTAYYLPEEEDVGIPRWKSRDVSITPIELFTLEHAKLAKEGEQWIKAIASSSTVVAALIVTVVFAAVFTVPGGNNSDGKPIFLHEVSFMIFAISDALALFSSTTSVLMFSGILISRYSQEDFLESLPNKLIIALITLFISIASMMVAFGATLYIFLVHRLKWVVIPIAILACLPVSLFAWLQFPLLVELIVSTHGRGILRPVK